MAYDKVIDSAVLDAGLKQIADAIREKGGTSDNLAFPAAMADAIAAIEAGGGSSDVSAGTITFSENTPVNGYTIIHGITSPKLFVIAGRTSSKAVGSLHTWMKCWSDMLSGVHTSINNKNATLYIGSEYTTVDNSISLTSLYASGEYFLANVQYWWVCCSGRV